MGAKLEIRRAMHAGTPAVLLVVRESRQCPGLSELLDEIGVYPTPDLLNHRSVLCTTAQALDEIRSQLRPYCDAAGNFVRPVAS